MKIDYIMINKVKFIENFVSYNNRMSIFEKNSEYFVSSGGGFYLDNNQ